MKTSRLVVGVVGVGVTVLALVIGLFGGFGGPVDALVGLFGNDYLVVSAVGVVAVSVATGVQVRRVRSGVDQATPPPAEEVYEAPRFGAELDAFLGKTAALDGEEPDAGRIREQLRELAVAVEMAESGCDRRVARRRVEEGEWTTDRVAASYLGDSGSIPGRERTLAGLRSESAAEVGVERAALELDRRASEVFE